MQLEYALRDNNICHIGLIVDKCECGEEIGFAKRVPTLTFNEWQKKEFS